MQHTDEKQTMQHTKIIEVSIDSISLDSILPYSQIPNILKLQKCGFSRKEGTFGPHFFLNKDDIRINFIQLRTLHYKLTVSFEFGKILKGHNVYLPSCEERFEVLRLVSTRVSELSGIRFNALTAIVRRVDFAMNFPYSNTQRLLHHLNNIQVPYLKASRKVNTMYFSNHSRTFRVYDKYTQMLSKKSDNDVLNQAAGIFRIELSLRKKKAVEDFLDKIGYSPFAEEIISQNCLDYAQHEIMSSMMLGHLIEEYDEVDYLPEILPRVNNRRKAQSINDFVNLLRRYGDNFHRNKELKYKRSKYYRKMQQFKDLGLII